MSKIIKNITTKSTIYIGEKHLDFEKDSEAEEKLGYILPLVRVVTDADGAKHIPIQEVLKIEQTLEEEKQKSFQSGFEEGHEQGLAQGLKEAENVLQKFDLAIKNAITQREALLEEARQKVLEIIIQISKKVTHDAITIDPEITLTMISRVIDTLIDRSKLKIKVNPDHLPIVEQNIDKFLEGSTTIKEITIEPDPRVKFGGCFIETPTGDIDARLGSQFEVIEDVLSSDEVES